MYLNAIEHYLGMFTSAVAGCRSSVASLQEQLYTSNAALFQQLQNSSRNVRTCATMLETNGSMAKEIEHLLRVNANHQADAGRWNMINEGLQHTIHQLKTQLLEREHVGEDTTSCNHAWI
jgi:hypothetical protein